MPGSASGSAAIPEVLALAVGRARTRAGRRTASQRTPHARAAALVEEHADAVWKFAAWMLQHREDAEDAVQETFIRAWRSLESFRGDASERTWLLAICRNVCIDRIRAKRHGDSLDELHEHGFEPPSSAQEDPENIVDRLVLDAAVATLPRDEREAFLLVDALGMSSVEAGTVCGVPASTVRSRRHRAHQRLVAEIGGGHDR